MLKISILKKAIDEAKKSEHKHRIGAVIFNKKIVYSTGRNFPCKAVKHLHPKYTKYPDSIHAEIDAIIKARKDVTNCSILVIRINKKEEIRYCFPCKYCIKYLKYVGIKNIYYSTNEDTIKRYKL
jgi:deoxycytidylate deaminase